MYAGIVLFGPTASGKTSLSIRLAQALDGEVINADSRQLYKGMTILTAAPTQDEQQGIAHHLFEMLDPRESISVARYADMAKQAVDDILSRGKIPIICGGTGFYLNVLMQGISTIPEIDEAIKFNLKQRAAVEGNAVLLHELKQVDTILGGRLKEADTQRILRALGVYQQTGKTLSHFQSLPKEGALEHKMLCVSLQPDKAWLNERIEARYHQMKKCGVEAEMQSLKDAGYTTDDHGIQTLGAREFFAYLEGRMSKEGVSDQIIRQTKKYAKRQLTWARTQYASDVILSEPCNDIEVILSRYKNSK